MENVPRMPSRYLMMYFAETDLQRTTYRVKSPSGVSHQIPTQVVLEHLAQTSGGELRQIEDIIRKIDFANGDLHDFLGHLATAIAAGYEQDGGMVTGSQDLKGELVKLGHVSPELRPHIAPVLDTLTREAGSSAVEVEVESIGRDECLINCTLRITEGNFLSHYQDLVKRSLFPTAKTVEDVMKKHHKSDFANIFSPGSDPRLVLMGGDPYLSLSVEVRGIGAREVEKWLTAHTKFRISLFA